jgi:hypothetical protein
MTDLIEAACQNGQRRPSPDIAPDAWQWRYRAIGETVGEWNLWQEGRAPHLNPANYDVEERPLYSADALAAQAAEIERLKELVDKYKWQVIDTCFRAEKAESSLAEIIKRNQLLEETDFGSVLRAARACAAAEKRKREDAEESMVEAQVSENNARNREELALRKLAEARAEIERLTKERDDAIRGQEFAEDLFNKNVGAHVAALDRADALATRVGLDVAAASNAGKREALKEIAKATQEVLAGAKNLDELRIAMKIAAAIRAKMEGK